MRTAFLLLLPLLTFVATVPPSKAAADGGPKKAMIAGGWSPIKNLNDPHVSELAQFAVSEHNKNANSNLALGRVIKGETQVVAGTNYRLVLAAKDGGKVANYEAVIWEKVWQNFKKLTSFKPV